MTPHTRKRLRLVGAATLIGAALCTPATASATDYGGNGNPATDCSGGYTVASAQVVYDFQTVGLVELRWSAACQGNWTRTTSYIGSRPLYSQIYVQANETVKASAGDTATSHFTPYLRVAPSTRMCSFGQINVGGVTARTAEICSN